MKPSRSSLAVTAILAAPSLLLAGCGSQPPDATGSYVWANQFFGSGESLAAADSEGSVIWAGTAMVGNDLQGKPLPSPRPAATIAAKIAAGKVLWSVPVGTANTTHVVALAPAESGSLVVAMQAQPVEGWEIQSGSYWGLAVVEKRDTNGALMWQRSFGDPVQQVTPIEGDGGYFGILGNTVWIADMAPAPQGGVVLVGRFTGTINFGTGPLTAEAGQFVVGLDVAGQATFASIFPLPAPLQPLSAHEHVVVDGDGLITAVGLQPTSLDDTPLTRLDPSGAVEWTRDDVPGSIQHIAAGADGSLAVTALRLDVPPADAATIWRERSFTKLDRDGGQIWSRVVDDPTALYVGDVAVDPWGDVIIAGACAGGALDLGAGPLTCGLSGNILVAKLGSDGKPRWNKLFGDSIADSVPHASLTPGGDIVLCGASSGSIDFGGGFLTGSDGDIFIAELTP